MPGLLANGKLVAVDGVTVIAPGEQPWAFVTKPKDACARAGAPSQWLLHKTIADDPERVLFGAGAPDGARATAEFWQQSDGVRQPKRYGAAHGVTGEDGVAACLADLVLDEVYHATVSNPYSVGWETRERVGGAVQQAALDATVAIACTGTRALGIQWQIPKLGSYTGHPLVRMLNGGRDCVGVFGHRDNTEQRGRWDPGDVLFQMLAKAGFEQFDFAAGEDRDVWSARQHDLNAKHGAGLLEDGIPGAKTTAALRAAGYVDGIWVLGKT
jgi:hypothetical protein